jgi:starch phosphorylase
MKPARTFYVSPSLPKALFPLQELAYNLRWSWSHETIDLFRRTDRDLWDKVYQNPVKLLGTIKQERLAEVEQDESMINQMVRCYDDFRQYMTDRTWFETKYKDENPNLSAAYFSMEFGISECLPVYSGGLGLLAGDHQKSASDLGVPLIGIGLLYTEGYFTQYLNLDGWQQEKYLDNDFYTMPLTRVDGEDGKPLFVHVEYPDGWCSAAVWKVDIGRNILYLLDTNVPENPPAFRGITAQLYGGDLDMRMRQEVLLGMGGIRMLFAMGHHPNVYHMNEGHSAFLALERIRMYMQEHGISFAEARSVVRASNVFTTHTPVPAGIDVFPPDMMDRYFANYYKSLGITRDRFLALGRKNADDKNEGFCMAVLATRLAAYINGVSELHGQVSREMWRDIWPALPLEEIPITHVTNGVHLYSWASKEMTDLLNRYLGPRALREPTNQEIWNRVDGLPAEELWRTHERRRERLVAFARKRLRQQLISRGAPPVEVERANEVLNPEALTIGFARRFATYKRADLLFRDEDRLIRILNDKERPVQIIMAGKAHPRDSGGKDLIRKIIHTAQRPELRNRVVFLENYDIHMARYLIQGVDVWLNTPRRPMEASGTSGMKACVNAVLNFSVLDGWWCEGYETSNGWAIGHGEIYDDQELQDQVESDGIYEILEHDIVPTYYDRGGDDLPRRWIEKMKSTLKTLCPVFNTDRMVKEYTNRFYISCAQRHDSLTADNCKLTREFTAWKQFIRGNWDKLHINNIESQLPEQPLVNQQYQVTAQIDLAELSSNDVLVELLYGVLDTEGLITEPVKLLMAPVGGKKKGATQFTAALTCETSGRYGYTVRIMPTHPQLSDPFKMGLMHWA